MGFFSVNTLSIIINYVAINNDLKNLQTQLYYIEMIIYHDQGYNDIGDVIATKLPILLAAVFLGTGNFSSKIVQGSFFLQWPPRCSKFIRALSRYCGMKFL